MAKTAMVFGQMNEPPGARARVALSALTVAEYFRDEMQQDVLLFIDNIFRFTQAGSEVSALLGRIPSAVGYQPTLGTDMGELQERITSTKHGSITSIQAIFVPADDYTDPAPAATFAHLDATTELSRPIFEAGIYPAVDPLTSSSSILRPEVVGQEHYQVARGVQEILQRYKELQDIIAILGMDELSEEDRSPSPAPARSSGSCRSRSLSPSSSRGRPAVSWSCRKPSGRSRRSWTANTTTCRNRRSISSGTLTPFGPRPATFACDRHVGFRSHHSDAGEPVPGAEGGIRRRSRLGRLFRCLVRPCPDGGRAGPRRCGGPFGGATNSFPH